jgi:hypothetical protein
MQSASYTADQQIAEMVAGDVPKMYQDEYPSAMVSFQDDWKARIAYMRCPTIHHKRICTTNLLERSFTEKSGINPQQPMTSQRPVAGSADECSTDCLAAQRAGTRRSVGDIFMV